MKHTIPSFVIVGLLALAPSALAPSALAQSAPSNPMSPSNGDTPTKATDPAPAAVSTSDNPRTTAAPVAGANSFTEGQARARMEEKGFGNVADLKKDPQGIWRATAMKDGKSVTVALDYQGNVVGQ